MKSSNCEEQHLKSQLWVDKYSPRDVGDLAVHTKKIAEVSAWLELKLNNSFESQLGSFVLVLTGPAGVGKTAVVRGIVKSLNGYLYEWDPPIPTLWKEYVHHANIGAPYLSKIQEFIAFLERVKKFPCLLFTQPEEELDVQRYGDKSLCGQRVLLLDDLPIAHGRHAEKQLLDALYAFALSVQFPTIVIVTEFSEGGENAQETNHFVSNVLLALESAGARKVTFNAITANYIKKVLTKISQAEKCVVPSDSLEFISESSRGDIRHAIHCLQFFCLASIPSHNMWDPGGSVHRSHKSKRKRILTSDLVNKVASSSSNSSFTCERGLTTLCRDGVLSLFHALGKVLHNKRHKEAAKDSGEQLNFTLIDHLQRHPLNMEIPETILAQSHVETSKFLSFLFENMLEFFNDDAVEDVSIAISYLSDVACLLGMKHTGRRCLPSPDEYHPMHLGEGIAASLLLRGILFANTNQEKHRWQSFRAPALWQAERHAEEKKVKFREKSWSLIIDSTSMVSSALQAIDYEPYCKHFGSNPWPSNYGMASSVGHLVQPNGRSCDDACEEETALLHEHDLSLCMRVVDASREADTGFDQLGDDEEDIENW